MRKSNVIRFKTINRCSHCGKATTSKLGVHPACVEAYETHWNERHKEMQYRAAMDATQGKYLKDLIHEVDNLRLSLKTVFDDQACICWQEDGTLSYFAHDDGLPSLYYTSWHVEDDPTDKQEDYTSLARFIPKLEQTIDTYTMYLIKSPVWCVDIVKMLRV